MKTIGTALRKKSPKSAPAGAMAQPAQELEIPVGERRRYRQFATMYTNTELMALYKRCRIKKFALTTTHFRVLIGVKEKSIRATLAQKAIKERLSVSALQRLAREKTKKKRGNREVSPAAESLRF